MDTHVIESVRVMRLKGTRRERAHQHGEFIAKLSKEDRDGLVFTPLSKKTRP